MPGVSCLLEHGRQRGNGPRRRGDHEQASRDRGGRAEPAEPASPVGIGPEPFDDSTDHGREPAARGEQRPPPWLVADRAQADPPAPASPAADRLLGRDLGANLVEPVRAGLHRVGGQVQGIAQRAVEFVLARVRATGVHD